MGSLLSLRGCWKHWHRRNFIAAFIAPAETHIICRPCFRARICCSAPFKQLLVLSRAARGWCISLHVFKALFGDMKFQIDHIVEWLMENDCSGCVTGFIGNLWTHWEHSTSAALCLLMDIWKPQSWSVKMCAHAVKWQSNLRKYQINSDEMLLQVVSCSRLLILILQCESGPNTVTHSDDIKTLKHFQPVCHENSH